MSQIVSKTSFINETEEINFFKKIKIQPLSQLVYFIEIRSFEVRYPKVSKNEQKKYLERKIKKVNKFFDYNMEFVQYVREEKSHLDTLYYTRANYNSLNFINTVVYYCPKEFCTSRDMLLGKVIGFENLVNYLQNKLFTLQNPSTMHIPEIHKNTKLKWTSSKVALTELIYALHSSGAINSGAADINELASVAERIFNVELGDYYRTFLEIRSRKINRTKYIDNLKESLIKRMQDSDE
jgi:hypothetical protein